MKNSKEWYFAKYAQVKQQANEKESQNVIVIDADIKSLHQQGIVLLRPLAANAAIIYIDDSLKKYFLDSMLYNYSPANNVWKYSTQFELEQLSSMQPKSSQASYIIVVKNTDTFLKQIIKNKSDIKIEHVESELNTVIINCTNATLMDEVIPMKEVVFADVNQKAHNEIMLSGFNKTINNVTACDYYYPNNNGQQITIGIKENKMNEDDIDLRQRVLATSQLTQGNNVHATTISTLAGGAGNSFISGRGIASQCTFFSSSYSNLFADNNSVLLQNNVSVQNHSYGTIIQSFYGAEALSYDVQTQQNKNLLHVFSCGNKGLDTPATGIYTGIAGFANISGNYKMAKNIISIAAIDTGNNVAPYSSNGPMYDGRMAPQLAALGANGTSESAAIVSGAIAKLQQVYKDLHAQQLPASSLIKAILFCTADDIGKPGIDYRSGFGALNLLNATECLQNNNYDSSALQQGDIWSKTITLPPSATHFKLALAWCDTAGIVNSYKALINDLDLELVEQSSGKIYYPWCLSSFPNNDSLSQQAIRRRDTLNTAELISIDIPSPGTYEIRVKATHIETFGKQNFNIAYAWDSISNFRFISPLQQSDFYLSNSAAEEIKIKWQTGATDSAATGTLSFTFDNGNSWKIIAPAVPLISKYFDWIVPDTNAFLQFRMVANNTTFFSPQMLLAKVSAIHVNYLCTDSFRLSWNNQPLAQSYQLYVLGDSAFLKTLVQQNDTFIVLQRNQHPENTYAVQPMLNNNIIAARSFAVDITNQGVACMYSSFYGIPVGNAIELTLELQYPEGVDSIVIEKLNANNIFEKEVTSFFTFPSVLSYSVFDPSPAEGANNYRSKIWFGGRFIYSEIITIVFTGKQWIFLFPNPIKAFQPISFVVKETTEELFLLIYNMQGQQLEQHSINSSGTISTEIYSPGIYFYKLTNSKNEILQNGKLIIYQQ